MTGTLIIFAAAASCTRLHDEHLRNMIPIRYFHRFRGPFSQAYNCFVSIDKRHSLVVFDSSSALLDR